jgi:glycosyltransferase involved in cell wall biosynthesis
MTRICYVIPSLSVGGTERQLTELIQGLALDHDQIVVCTRGGGVLAGDVRRAGVDVHILDTKTAWDPSLFWKLRKLFQKHRPDIVHSFMSGFDLTANLAARNARVPVVVSSRRELATWMKRRHRLMQNWANRCVDCIVANSRAVVQYAVENEKVDPSLFRVIPNGIRAEAFVSHTDRHDLLLRHRIPFHHRIIGMVANFSPVKDHALFVKTAELLIKRRADVHFLLVGRGPLVGAIEGLIAARGMESSFTRVAAFDEIPDLYALMDVSVLCSKAEGCPNVIMESMAAGRPVVAVAVGGITEILRDGDTGCLVHSRDPADFADAIECVLDHPDESRAMAERAGRFVRTELTLDRMVESYRRLYAELLANTQRKGR